MIVNKNHKKLFKDILNFYFANQERIIWMQNNLGVGTDQPIINFFVQKENVDFKLLPYEYNMQDLMRFEALGEDMLHTRHGLVYHFNCWPRPTPSFWIEQTYRFLYDNIS